MNSSSLVSVIIPCYNAEKWVADAINGILRQTYSPIEIIVIDDGSTDGSLDVIRSFGDRVRYETGPNRGGSAARNRGLALSRGEYVMFHDADDLIAPDTIEVLVTALSAVDTHHFAGCDWQHLIQKRAEWMPVKYRASSDSLPEGDYITGWLRGWYIPPVAIMWPRELVDALGGWDETLSANQDGDLVLRALVGGASLLRVSGGGAYYRQHRTGHVSVGSSRSLEAVRSRMRVLEKAEQQLLQTGKLGDYAIPLGQAFHSLGVGTFSIDRDLAQLCWQHAHRLAGAQSITGSWAHRLGCKVFGIERKARLTELATTLGVTGLRRRWIRHRIERNLPVQQQ